MGRSRGPYNEEFPVGTVVQIVDERHLRRFQSEWNLHNPLTDEQVPFAGTPAVVKSVGFYHGGDELYTLEGLPGVWHEECLLKAGST